MIGLLLKVFFAERMKKPINPLWVVLTARATHPYLILMFHLESLPNLPIPTKLLPGFHLGTENSAMDDDLSGMIIGLILKVFFAEQMKNPINPLWVVLTASTAHP